MPYVKVPGIEREIFLELHEPQGTETPGLVSVGHEVKLTPEQFAAEMANATSEWKFSAPHQSVRRFQSIQLESARRFQKARTRPAGTAGRRTGRPFGHTFSRAEDFAITVLHMESLGYKQSTRQAKIQWQKFGQHPPTARQIEEGLKVVRSWVIENLDDAAMRIRKMYRIPIAMLVAPKPKRRR